MKQDIELHVFNRISEAVALILWHDNAVKINLEEPFKLASGNFSPIYINCRQVISNPVLMDLFVAAARQIIIDQNVEADAVAGGETAGIPFAAYISARLSKPMHYIRKAKKGYGLANLVEGGSVSGKNVLLVEDLITDAGSKLHFINAIMNAGGAVTNVLVLFDRLQGGKELLEEKGVRLHSVTDLNVTLSVAASVELFTSDELSEVRDYLQDPKKWHQARGFEFTGN